MNVRELYNFIQDKYPAERRDLNTLAWPLHQPTLGVQFLNKDGSRISPIVSSPTDILFLEPLAGHFYDLTVVGIAPVFRNGFKRLSRWKQVRFVVQSQSGLTLSSIVQLRITPDELKGLIGEMGIQWYHVNFDWPWKFTPVNSLDDCVKYERKTNESCVQLH